MSHDLPIRRITIAEQADLAARRTAETGLMEPNPHPMGSDDALAWHNAYCRYLLWHTAPHSEGSA